MKIQTWALVIVCITGFLGIAAFFDEAIGAVELLVGMGVAILLFVWGRKRVALYKKASKREKIIRDQAPLAIITYQGDQRRVTALYQADALDMSTLGYFPTMQSWAPSLPQWRNALSPSLAVQIVIFLFDLLAKPTGTLTVTYERRAQDNLLQAGTLAPGASDTL